jgi:hypothetical protein
MTSTQSDVEIQIKSEVATWADQTRALLSSCRQLIAYFGTKEEVASWDAAIAVPMAYVDLVVATKKSSTKESLRLPWSVNALECSETVARIISPLVQLVSGPIPKFIRTIRESGLSDDQKMLILSFGCFSSGFGTNVSESLWEKYRQLAPQEWLEFNSEPDPGTVGASPEK